MEKTRIGQRILALVLSLAVLGVTTPPVVFAEDEDNAAPAEIQLNEAAEGEGTPTEGGGEGGEGGGDTPVTPPAATPTDFTITVTDGTDPIEDATVTYSITATAPDPAPAAGGGDGGAGDSFTPPEDVTDATTNTDASGIATLSEMADFADALTNGYTVELTYSVTMDGYTTQSDTATVDNVARNIDVALEKSTYTVTVNKTGNGTVKIDSTEVTTPSVEIDKTAGSFTLELEPTAGSYLKAVTVDSVDLPDFSRDTLSYTINLSGNTSVDVTFMEEYTVTLSSIANCCTLVLTKQGETEATTDTKFDRGTALTLTAEVEENYRLKKVTVAEESGAPIDYTPQQVAAGVSITVNDNLTVTPEVMEIYTVTADCGDGGTMDIQSEVTDAYEQNATITITQNPGYVLSGLTVVKTGDPAATPDDVLASASQDGTGNITYTLTNVTEAKTVRATFAEAADVAEENPATVVTLNEADILRQDGTNWIFSNQVGHTGPTLTTTKAGLRVGTEGAIDQNTMTISADTTISELWVYSQEGSEPFATWHQVTGSPLIGKTIVIDTAADEPTVTASGTQYGEYYTSDVTLAITATDGGAGLATVDYQIVKDGTAGATVNLYTYTAAAPGDPATEILTRFSDDTHTVVAADNDSDNVQVVVTVVDRAGNTATKTLDLKIAATKPAVAVAFNGPETAKNGTYYADSRAATITVTDRSDTWDSSKVTLNIAAKDGKNQDVANSYTLGDWTDNGNGTYTATLTFNGDANYTWSVSYTNKAGYAVAQGTDNAPTYTGDNPNTFTVDKTAPQNGRIWIYKSDVEVKKDKDSWLNTLLTTLTFGTWRNYALTAAVTDGEAADYNGSQAHMDDTSPVTVGYLVLDKAELPATTTILDGKTFAPEAPPVDPEKEFVIFAKLTDYAGNTSYISTDGIILDHTAGAATLTVETAAVSLPPLEDGTPQYLTLADGTLVYSGDVVLSASANDTASAISAGLDSITYQIFKNDAAVGGPVVLYKWAGATADTDVLTSWDSTMGSKITVDSTQISGDNVAVELTVTDRAGNVATTTQKLAINTATPTAVVSYDAAHNSPVTTHNGRGYFDKARVATVTITDQASGFDPAAATAWLAGKITAANAKGNIALNAVTEEGVTKVKAGETVMATISAWTSQGDTHTATVTFQGDGNYTWNLDQVDAAPYTNKLGRAVDTVTSSAGAATPFNFTVDTVAPESGENGKITVSVENDHYKTLLSVLTFRNVSRALKMTVESADCDATSPCTVEYATTTSAVVINPDNIHEAMDKLSYQPYEREVTFSPDVRFIVYVRVTDYAGNRSYASTGGYVIDTRSPSLSASARGETVNGIYNKESSPSVSTSASDSEPSSGLGSISYTITAGSTQTKSGRVSGGSVPVDKADNNACDVTIRLSVSDGVGNSAHTTVKMDIDNTSPTIQLTYDDTANPGAREGYFTSRKATVVITERTHHFNAEKATAGITITAKDGAGQEVANAYTISQWETKNSPTNPNLDTHTATITYLKDANYTFDMKYSDEAGNPNDPIITTGQAAPFAFTVDSSVPAGVLKAVTAEGRVEEWSDLKSLLTFGFWSQQKITLSLTHTDPTSPLEKVEYHKVTAVEAVDGTEALTAAKLDQVRDWQKFETLEITPNEQSVVYVRLTDSAGNYTYISSNGLIVDDQRPLGASIAPEISIEPEKPINGIYSGDVRVDIEVEDPLSGGTYSGLNTVRYQVFDRAVSATEPTQEGELYSFTTENPKQNELLQKWTGSITVEAAKNNSNDVQIVVYAKDNVGSGSENSETIKIDVTAPRVDIRYDQNQEFDNGNVFRADRVAAIQITERNFDPAGVSVTVTNTETVIPTLTEWVKVPGTGNEDDTVWTANLAYTADGDYTFDITYTDQAGNLMSGVNYAEGTVAPTEFTLDKTMPTIQVSMDGAPQNGKYFSAPRTATITVVEHNFDPTRVIPLINGAASAIGSWSTNGDSHSATLRFAEDGDYTFAISMSDRAGNAITDAEVSYGNAGVDRDFTVDTRPPEIAFAGLDSFVNSGEVTPVISFTDTNYNFDDAATSLVLTLADQAEPMDIQGSRQNAAEGISFHITNFDTQENVDGIYTLTARVTDLAGNVYEDTRSFSVNRFGSTYDLSPETEKVNGAYIKTPQDVVMTEVNVNRLSNITVTLFKNNETLVLTENVDYRLEVAGSQETGFRYTYTVFAKNFEEEGTYRISFHSEDEAGNVAENTLDTKGKDITFGVDKQPPNIVVANVESNTTYAVSSIEASILASDNLQLTSVEVYLDDLEKPQMVWSGEELLDLLRSGNGQFSIPITDESTRAHQLRVVCVDAAGNEQIQEIVDFYVTTNLWVRYYTNEPLFYGSIAGAVAAVGGVTTGVVLKRRKKAESGETP